MSIDKFVRNNPHLEFYPARHFRGEGEEGVKNLARLCRGLGYNDPMNFGQFEGASYGDLIYFLEDNSGLIEHILTWVEENFEEELTEGSTDEEDDEFDNFDDEDSDDDDDDDDYAKDDDDDD